MDSRREEATVAFAEIRLDRVGVFTSSPSPSPSPYAEAKSSGCTITYSASGECLTFEGEPGPPAGFRRVGPSHSGPNRLGDLLWVRDEPIDVAIVDDDSGARRFLQRILEQSGGYRCVGRYASGEEALREVPRLRPRIVLMELRMPGLSGIECMRRLKGRLPGLIVVLVSAVTDAETMTEALVAGGDGYLTKPFGVAQCLATIRFSIRPDRSVPPDCGAVHEPSTRSGSAPLTEREHHLMSCLAKGLLYKEIADELRLSFSMVHKLQHRIFLKLRVNNRTEAVTQWRKGNGG